MILELIGITLEFVGTVLIAIGVLTVHKRVMDERKIDDVIIGEIRRERLVAMAGIILIVLGYLLQLPSKL